MRSKIINSKLFILASSIKVCSRNTPNPSGCILNAINDLRLRLATGDLGDGVKSVPLEPLSLDNIHIKRGPEFTASFNNLLVDGPSNFVVSKLKYVHFISMITGRKNTFFTFFFPLQS